MPVDRSASRSLPTRTAHSAAHGAHLPAPGDRRALVISGWLTGAYFVIELGIALWTGRSP